MKRYLYKIRPWLLSKTEEFRYSKEYYYTRIFHKYDRLEAYLAVYKKCDVPGTLKTGTVISFLKNVAFGAPIKQVIPRLPTSRYDILDNDALNVKVVFYKLVIGEHRVKCHIHFFADQMFLCSYTFSHLKEGEYEKVIAILQKKYLPGVGYHASQVISDAQGNCICVETGVELIINYLSLNDGLCVAMANYQEERRQQQVEKVSAGETEIFNRL